MFIQVYEFKHAGFSINDSVFGSIFFFLTGFHGLHVLIGILFIAVIFARVTEFQLYKDEHTALELSVWYWHFVDVV
jgi:heme/copper-type cytochrome/quinol oxidase subunit 3